MTEEENILVFKNKSKFNKTRSIEKDLLSGKSFKEVMEGVDLSEVAVKKIEHIFNGEKNNRIHEINETLGENLINTLDSELLNKIICVDLLLCYRDRDYNPVIIKLLNNNNFKAYGLLLEKIENHIDNGYPEFEYTGDLYNSHKMDRFCNIVIDGVLNYWMSLKWVNESTIIGEDELLKLFDKTIRLLNKVVCERYSKFSEFNASDMMFNMDNWYKEIIKTNYRTSDTRNMVNVINEAVVKHKQLLPLFKNIFKQFNDVEESPLKSTYTLVDAIFNGNQDVIDILSKKLIIAKVEFNDFFIKRLFSEMKNIDRNKKYTGYTDYKKINFNKVIDFSNNNFDLKIENKDFINILPYVNKKIFNLILKRNEININTPIYEKIIDKVSYSFSIKDLCIVHKLIVDMKDSVVGLDKVLNAELYDAKEGNVLKLLNGIQSRKLIDDIGDNFLIANKTKILLNSIIKNELSAARISNEDLENSMRLRNKNNLSKQLDVIVEDIVVKKNKI